MEADDLRIGNWVKDIKKGYVSIHGIEPNWDEVWLNYCHGSGIYKKRIIDIEPIPLTEELLLKCGFDVRRYDYNPGDGQTAELVRLTPCGYYQSFRMSKGNNWEYWTYYHCGGDEQVNIVDIEIKSLHQLQNLYFALTGKELKIAI